MVFKYIYDLPFCYEASRGSSFTTESVLSNKWVYIWIFETTTEHEICMYVCMYVCMCYIRGPFEKFVDSPYYSESEPCGGAVTVSLSNYLPWQAMRFLQRSTHFSQTCCRPFAASFRRIVEQAVLTSELPFHGLKSPEISWGEIWTVWRMS
jgi:hypothetical protein